MLIGLLGTGGHVRAAQRPAALDGLDAYIGHWQSQERTDRQGDAFHFEYDLHWFDAERTIAKMLITRIAGDETTVIFEGYKGLDPEGGIYYFGASPSGRASRGEVMMEGDALVTIYDGWTAAGDVVHIRDVFDPLAEGGNAFVSRTFLRESHDAEWQQIGEDHWRRTGS